MRTILTFVVAFIVILFTLSAIFNRGADALTFVLIAAVALIITGIDHRYRARTRAQS